VTTLARSGTLVIIGGHEEKEEEPLILKDVVRRVGAGKLVVATVASEHPADMWEQYERVFRRLGVQHLYRLDIESREDARSERKMKVLEDAIGVYCTGGDQHRITTLVGDSPIRDRLNEIYTSGGVIAGTSAGASVMSETMLVGGGGESSARVGHTVRMAPGLGFIKDVLVDQHFAERGRVPRMLGAIAHNPRILGLGIDENTAAVIDQWGRRLWVVGEGAAYIFDARTMTYANISEEEPDRSLSVFSTTLHVLSQGDRFDLTTRTPTNAPAAEVEREIEEEAAA
jgi:cyanophycinase